MFISNIPNGDNQRSQVPGPAGLAKTANVGGAHTGGPKKYYGTG